MREFRLVLFLALVTGIQGTNLYRRSYKGVFGFDLPKQVGLITNAPFGDISPAGIASSAIHEGILYFVSDDDGSNEPVVFCVDTSTADIVGSVTITDARNRDWEDMAGGVCPGDSSKSCLYIVDRSGTERVYIIEEPTDPRKQTTTSTVDQYAYEFVGESDNSDAIFVTPQGDVYLFNDVTDGLRVKLFRIPDDGSDSRIAEAVVALDLTSRGTGPNAADLSKDGCELLVQMDDNIYYFLIEDGDFRNSLLKEQIILPSKPDYDGTSITWAADGSGFFISEELQPARLQFSARNQKAKDQIFTYGQVIGDVSDLYLASGAMAASRRFPGLLYVVDSYDDTTVYIIDSKNGLNVGILRLSGVTNDDWEDMAVGPCDSGSADYCIYIQNDGDGAHQYIKVPEPADPLSINTYDVPSADVVTYITDSPESRTIMVSPFRDIFLIEYGLFVENTRVARLHKIETSGSLSFTVIVGEFNFTSLSDGPVSGDISPDGSEMIIKTMDRMFYWHVTKGKYGQALSTPPCELSYFIERRGETVTFDANGVSLYTLNKDSDRSILKRYYRIQRQCEKETHLYQ
ncbi:uncharacterized protein [Haliotis cracherodii]|uniref:uncharacterized protein n=1 Tax=Haliotis cracherodii TaxID=6455 RepID=UPI0039ECE70D